MKIVPYIIILSVFSICSAQANECSKSPLNELEIYASYEWDSPLTIFVDNVNKFPKVALNRESVDYILSSHYGLEKDIFGLLKHGNYSFLDIGPFIAIVRDKIDLGIKRENYMSVVKLLSGKNSVIKTYSSEAIYPKISKVKQVVDETSTSGMDYHTRKKLEHLGLIESNGKIRLDSLRNYLDYHSNLPTEIQNAIKSTIENSFTKYEFPSHLNLDQKQLYESNFVSVKVIPQDSFYIDGNGIQGLKDPGYRTQEVKLEVSAGENYKVIAIVYGGKEGNRPTGFGSRLIDGGNNFSIEPSKKHFSFVNQDSYGVHGHFSLTRAIQFIVLKMNTEGNPEIVEKVQLRF